MDDEVVAKFCSRYGWTECTLCERPALMRIREWKRFGRFFAVCYLHYMNGKHDPDGNERPSEWIEVPKGP